MTPGLTRELLMMGWPWREDSNQAAICSLSFYLTGTPILMAQIKKSNVYNGIVVICQQKRANSQKKRGALFYFPRFCLMAQAAKVVIKLKLDVYKALLARLPSYSSPHPGLYIWLDNHSPVVALNFRSSGICKSTPSWCTYCSVPPPLSLFSPFSYLRILAICFSVDTLPRSFQVSPLIASTVL